VPTSYLQGNEEGETMREKPTECERSHKWTGPHCAHHTFLLKKKSRQKKTNELRSPKGKREQRGI